MQFFSGFSLKDDACFFDAYRDKSDFTVSGFSYGAIKALKYTLQMIEEGKRVDRLQLFSPAFFQTKALKFKRLQLMAYKKNQEAYIEQFLEACFSPYEKKQVQKSETKIKELQELLEYEWSLVQLSELRSKGVVIEVYLGGEDKIVDASRSKEFFREVSTVTYIKKANHFLEVS